MLVGRLAAWFRSRPFGGMGGAPKGEIGRGAVLSFAVLFQGYYHFSSGVALFQVPDRLGDFTQLVAPVDHRS